MKKLAVVLIFCFIYIISFSQNYTQTIRGIVADKDSRLPVIGANVILAGSNPLIGAVSDEHGNFRLTGVPLGRQSIRITLMGYNTVEINNILVGSAKEIVLDISLEEKVTEMDEVVVKAPVRKDRPINEMAVVSARSFTIEETEKYAGSRGDIARMASNYAGVSFANDQRNDIIIRGNSPLGLLWKLEDLDIPNPNHFAENGTTGGPVGMLNNNVLKNSDFLTGAFPAEYGNALSGVFDLKMRNGNNEKNEYVFQCGFNGFEIGVEGPFSKKQSASYLANFRYSTLEVLDYMGVNFGTQGVPKYMDGTYKINIPLKKGQITWFGIGGKSQIAMLQSNKKSVNLYTADDQDTYSSSDMIASGLSVTYLLSKKSYGRIILSGLDQNTSSQIDTLDINRNVHRIVDHNIGDFKISLSAIFGTKFSARLNTKSGFTIDRMGYDIDTRSFNNDSMKMISRLKGSKSLANGTDLIRIFYEVNYKLTEKVVFNPGIHLMYFSLNKQASPEPRIGFSWAYGKNRRLNFGYGLHSRIQPLSVYFFGSHIIKNEVVNGVVVPRFIYTETNKDLQFTKSHHFVAGHDWSISRSLRFKFETYYQYLFDVPVEQRETYFSILNVGAGWGIVNTDSLVNKGKGYNYGCEITVEKFLSKNYYFLITSSLFDSKYRGSDNKLRNTLFNGNYIFNVLVGYEYPINSKWSVAFDGKATLAGGKRRIPVDIQRSVLANNTRYDYTNSFDERYPDFFKTDFKITIRSNGKRYSQEWQIYIENITDHQNILDEHFSKSQKAIVRTYQLGRFPGNFPLVNYRLNF